MTRLQQKCGNRLALVFDEAMLEAPDMMPSQQDYSAK